MGSLMRSGDFELTLPRALLVLAHHLLLMRVRVCLSIADGATPKTTKRRGGSGCGNAETFPRTGSR